MILAFVPSYSRALLLLNFMTFNWCKQLRNWEMNTSYLLTMSIPCNEWETSNKQPFAAPIPSCSKTKFWIHRVSLGTLQFSISYTLEVNAFYSENSSFSPHPTFLSLFLFSPFLFLSCFPSFLHFSSLLNFLPLLMFPVVSTPLVLPMLATVPGLTPFKDFARPVSLFSI